MIEHNEFLDTVKNFTLGDLYYLFNKGKCAYCNKFLKLKSGNIKLQFNAKNKIWVGKKPADNMHIKNSLMSNEITFDTKHIIDFKKDSFSLNCSGKNSNHNFYMYLSTVANFDSIKSKIFIDFDINNQFMIRYHEFMINNFVQEPSLIRFIDNYPDTVILEQEPSSIQDLIEKTTNLIKNINEYLLFI